MENKIKILLLPLAIASLLALGTSAMASEVTGTLNTNPSTIDGNLGTLNGGVSTVNGVVIVDPTASPVAGTYTSAQSVTLTASGSSSINYTIDGSIPTCSTGTAYSGAISVNSTETINAISCYLDSSGVAHPSTVAAYTYTINTSTGGTTTTTSSGSVSGGSYTPPPTNPVWDSVNVGILDLSIMASEWGQTGSNLSADLNHDGVVDILDLSILAANWNGQ